MHQLLIFTPKLLLSSPRALALICFQLRSASSSITPETHACARYVTVIEHICLLFLRQKKALCSAAVECDEGINYFYFYFLEYRYFYIVIFMQKWLKTKTFHPILLLKNHIQYQLFFFIIDNKC